MGKNADNIYWNDFNWIRPSKYSKSLNLLILAYDGMVKSILIKGKLSIKNMFSLPFKFQSESINSLVAQSCKFFLLKFITITPNDMELGSFIKPHDLILLFLNYFFKFANLGIKHLPRVTQSHINDLISN